ncbi:MAG TPA: hypothetical protein VFX80_14005 [Solirubrobacteraceae bacterium]|nr:hypothetical protein [Solirubrobacteraceae bacterium]
MRSTETFTFGGPTASSWREQALTRVAELENLALSFGNKDSAVVQGMLRHLETARKAADGGEHSRLGRLRPFLGGSPLERTASNLHAAEIDLLRVAPTSYLYGQLPSLLANARAHLAAEDPRRQAIEAIYLKEAAGRELTEDERNTVIAVSRAANSALRREIVQIRSFRNVLYATAMVLAFVSIGLVVLGATRPELIPLCFHPDNAVVCPTDVVGGVSQKSAPAVVDYQIRDAAGRSDVPLVAILGLAAAVLSAALSLRKLQGTTLPYSLPVALAVLKLPLGALTAVIGLLLMRGEFVPGLSALDSPAQILAWAVLFGYAQQLFTQFVDQRAQGLLDQVSKQDVPATVSRERVASRAPEAQTSPAS